METTTQKQIENEASKRRNIYLTGEHGAIAYREFLNGAKYAAQSTVLIKDKVSFDELDALRRQVFQLKFEMKRIHQIINNRRFGRVSKIKKMLAKIYLEKEVSND